MKRKIIKVILVFVLIMVSFTVGKFYIDNDHRAIKDELLIPSGAVQKGSDNPKVELVEFLDPQCESCRAFYPVIKEIMTKYPQQIRLTVRYIPFHDYSELAIKILESSRLQKKYWQTLEIIFKYQPYWGGHHSPRPNLLWKFLPEAGLDMNKLKVDIENPQWLKIIQRDKQDAETLQIRKTPTFFVNGVRLKKFGEVPLIDLIESQLN